MAATPTICWQSKNGNAVGARVRRGQGAGTAPSTFIRVMQTMKREQHGMSDRFEDDCLCGAVRSWLPANLAFSRSVTKTG